MRRLLLDLGLPNEALRLEEGNTNTVSNAKALVARLTAEVLNGVLLVTSALHMPRALQPVANLQVRGD